MSLVLRWSVPDPRVAICWRGPARLAEAIEREPLNPVAAVVGPPGSGGDAVFPLLAVQADATAPVPSGGTGSAIWSTVLNEPMFWDGLAWRTIAHFANETAIPDWVPSGAMVVSHFKNGNYWRQDLGVCTLGDIWEAGAGYNGLFDPGSDVIPGSGIIGSQVPQVVPDVLAMLSPGGDGFTAVLDFHVGQGVGSGADAHLGIIFTESNYSNEWGGGVLLSSTANPGTQNLPGFNAMDIGDYDGFEPPFDYPWVAEMPGVAMLGPHRVAVSMNADGVAVAANGHGPIERAREDFTYLPKSDPSWEMLVLACFDHDDAVAYAEKAVFYPHKSIADLNALTVPTALPPPDNTALPTIAGFAWVGEMLTATVGSWTNSPSAFAYQWRANGVDIVAATSSTYLLSEAELGATITVAVIAANASGDSDEAVSTATNVVAGNFWRDFTTGFLPTAVTLTRASGPATWYDNTGQMQATSSANVARFDHDPVTLAPLGLMVEPAATNLLLNSGSLSLLSAPAGAAVTANSAVAPDGTTAASKITENTSSGRHMIAGTLTGLADAQLVMSAHLKAGAPRNFGVVGAGNSTFNGFRGQVADLVTGEAGTGFTSGAPTTPSSGAFPAGSGYHRIFSSLDTDGSTAYVRIGLSDTNSPSSWQYEIPTYTGNGTAFMYAWGGQVELGAIPTSYIPTASSIATRAADVLTVTVPAGYSSLLFTYDDDSTSLIPCVAGANVYTAAHFARHRIRSLAGVA